jgi:pimeloyl-ACP methyl ester carboxylesterase
VDAVWKGRIVSESAISARIASARKAVGDNGKSQSVTRTVARRGLQLAYAVMGDGLNLMRFASPMTMDLEYERRAPSERAFIDTLTRQFRFARFDHLGSGQSERVEPQLDFAAQAHDTLAVADAAGFDSCAGVSLSGGVLVAIHFAALLPGRISRLAIVGGYAEGRVRPGQTDNNDTLKTLIAEGWGDFEIAFATAFPTSYFPEGPLEDVRNIVKMMQTACPLDVMLRDRDAINSASVAHLLKDVRCPTLIIHGRHDSVHPLTEAQKLAVGIPDAELVILETGNHVPLPGNPCREPFTDTLIRFLDG